MKIRICLLLLFLGFLACNNTKEKKPDNKDNEIKEEVKFDKANWAIKEGRDYPYRNQMVNDILYNDTVRTLNKDEIIGLLGKPDRSNDGHLYYMITQKRLLTHPLHQKTLVIKFSNDSTINWIKIHQ